MYCTSAVGSSTPENLSDPGALQQPLLDSPQPAEPAGDQGMDERGDAGDAAPTQLVVGPETTARAAAKMPSSGSMHDCQCVWVMRNWKMIPGSAIISSL